VIRNLSTVGAAVLLISGTAHASEFSAADSRRIDALFDDIDHASQPGCAAGVIQGGQYVHKRGYGLANLEHSIPISSASVFRTGSVSKQFTATAIAILAERGDIDLDADVHEYLPDLTDYGSAVTVRQMVHHISGMGDYDPDLFRKADGTEFRFGNEDYWTIDEFYQAVRKVPLVLEPGAKYQYSNLAYFLLSQVVERVSGMMLREFAAEEIFGPLNMSASLFNDNVNQPVPHRADGYRLMDDGSYEIFMTNLDWVGDGGVYTNLDDFLHWDQNFYANRLNGKSATLNEMLTTPHPDAVPESGGSFTPAGYAYGMAVGEQFGLPTIKHTGGWVAFSSVYQRFPTLSLSVVVFCNSTDASAPDLGEQIAELAVQAVTE